MPACRALWPARRIFFDLFPVIDAGGQLKSCRQSGVILRNVLARLHHRLKRQCGLHRLWLLSNCRFDVNATMQRFLLIGLENGVLRMRIPTLRPADAFVTSASSDAPVSNVRFEIVLYILSALSRSQIRYLCNRRFCMNESVLTA